MGSLLFAHLAWEYLDPLRKPEHFPLVPAHTFDHALDVVCHCNETVVAEATQCLSGGSSQELMHLLVILISAFLATAVHGCWSSCCAIRGRPVHLDLLRGGHEVARAVDPGQFGPADGTFWRSRHRDA